MKLYTVVLTAVFLCLISTVLRNAVFYTEKLEQEVNQVFLSYSAKKFIAQSFKNTCNGKGFNSLDQWKLVCSELFELDYITYKPIENEENLIHAQWRGNQKLLKCSDEVYFRIENGDGL